MFRKTFAIQCPQGHPMTVSSFHVGLQVPCPTCHTLVVVPTAEDLTTPNGKPSVLSREHTAAPMAALAEEEEPLVPLEEHAGLARVRLGLAFFMAEIIVWALGLVTLFGAGMVIGVQVQMEAERDAQARRAAGDKNAPDPKDPIQLQQDPKFQQKLDEKAAQLQDVIFYGGQSVIFVTHVLWMIGALFCLSVPPAARARNLILACLGCIVARTVVLFLVATQQFPQIIEVLAWLVVASYTMSPFLYEMFLGRVAQYVDRRDLRFHSFLLMIAGYVLLGLSIALVVVAEVAKGQNDPAMQMVVGFGALGLLFAGGIWFIFYVILLIRLRMAITYALHN